jgi:hypothetical protein
MRQQRHLSAAKKYIFSSIAVISQPDVSRLCEEADFGAQNCQHSTKVDARYNVQLTTEPAFLQNRCYKLAFYLSLLFCPYFAVSWCVGLVALLDFFLRWFVRWKKNTNVPPKALAYPVIPFINVSTKSKIRFKILSPIFLRCNKLGFSPSMSSKTSSRKGSLSAKR